MNGGYINIDFKGLELLSEEKVTVSGIYEAVENAHQTGKAIFAANCKHNGKAMSPIPVMVNKSGDTEYNATASTLALFIGTDDGVTITNLITPTNEF